MPISIFGFQALWSPYLIGVIVFLTVVYFLVTVTWRKDFKVSEPLKKIEAIYFILGMIVLYIVKGSPVDLLGHIMFTMHMTQMALLLLLVPVFIIKGIPWWVWKVIVEAPVVRTIFKIFTKPLLAILLFTGLFSVYHLPVVFDAIKLNETVHGIFTMILFLAALFMYWPLLNEVEGQHKMKNIHKLGYIAANAVLITPACALIIFASSPMYGTYSDSEMWMKAMELCVPASTLSELTLSGPELFSSMDLVTDQQVGGVLMKIIQEIIFGVILFRIFRKWWNSERSNQQEITENALKEFQNRTQY
ncbi:cytochrome c oxidase assembly factor CtaG [Lysinibacillus sp. 2017]|uniref:cytochrome c oxidase assembly factor CtaG n=1 Tax=unclassified Lysinibacillus TaxID=2636778 RepID=UPI000D529C4D|nr:MULTISPECIES: cytochrome c oxidase assembly factor CtaG [unclassified Lysinibacillus]AWE06551.1 cytochrome c oxidase assembly factor CtaG [Lysinibacillus sp. 2017]TGN35412.1 cytochrome c oxidase assembly factor CtaG [Lysinibacillus sp. S2017]